MRSLVGLLVLAVVLAGCGVETATGPRAEQCGTCHQAQYAQWQGSRHGQSTSSPVFTALLPRVERAWGATARARCVACHQPGHGGDETIGCVSCHQAIGNRGDANGALVVKLGIPEPYSDCDGNGRNDACDIAVGAADVNRNGKLDACEIAYGDFNLDGAVTGADLGMMLGVWGIPNPPYGDLNGDNIVTGADLGLLLSRWGPVG